MSAPPAHGDPPGIFVHGASEVATLAGGVRRGSSQGDAALLPATRHPAVPAVGDAGLPPAPDGVDVRGGFAVACWEGRIVATGTTREVRRRLVAEGIDPDGPRVLRVDAHGGTLTPGLIDPHTHLLFAGSREREIGLRQQGAGYLEILAAGGGILSTVAHTRAASSDVLLEHGRRWLRVMLEHGVTTVEAKSGYGLERGTELRLLELAGRLGAEGPAEVIPTFLGAHAVGPEYRGRPAATEGYVDDVIERQLPAVAVQGIARSCDVFCEAGVFSAAQSRRILDAGRRLGLAPRLHADELAPSGGAELAAELGACSADHLGAPSDAGIDALASTNEAGRTVVATLLPATSLFLGGGHHAPARRLIERGVPVALGTDFNPGTSPTASLPLVISLGVLELGLSAAEALAAVTINAAQALGLAATHGSLEPGKQADLVVWDVPTIEQIPYWLGTDLVRAVVKRGSLVAGA